MWGRKEAGGRWRCLGSSMVTLPQEDHGGYGDQGVFGGVRGKWKTKKRGEIPPKNKKNKVSFNTSWRSVCPQILFTFSLRGCFHGLCLTACRSCWAHFWVPCLFLPLYHLLCYWLLKMVSSNHTFPLF